MKKWITLAALVAVAGMAGLWVYGRPAYRHHKETQFLARTRQFMAAGDFRNASLSARQTLLVNPSNLEACRMMAEMAEMSRSPHALDWRRRMVELAPTVENKLLLASIAIHTQGPPSPLATQTLEELGDSAKNIPAFHVLSAELALKLGKPAQATAQFEAAKQLEPSNEIHQLNIAVLGLDSTNEARAAEAHATLEQLRGNKDVGAVALRWLVAEGVRKKDWVSAETYSSQLLSTPRLNLDDRLQHLRILYETKNPEFKDYLALLQKEAGTNGTQIYEITTWMVEHSMAGQGMQWLTNLPVKVQTEQPVPLSIMDCYVGLKDWAGLENFLQPGKWADFEFLRQAFLSRSASEQKQALAADSRWRSAVREAGDRLGPLTGLLNLATVWGRDKAKEDVLWLIGQRFPSERWAFRELGNIYMAQGNTLALNKLYSAMVAFDPKNFVVKNNLAATSMLLQLNMAPAHELAREVYGEHPDEPIVASTFAYSLHLQGRTKEGLAALEKLNTPALETPAVALYYGVLLTAAGKTNQAGKYLAYACALGLLPEEKALLTQASKEIATP